MGAVGLEKMMGTENRWQYYLSTLMFHYFYLYPTPPAPRVTMRLDMELNRLLV
ncbi:MAG: hypothetical protein GY765_42870 [bacterium]|nr:hypothetical protein [bacterium]